MSYLLLYSIGLVLLLPNPYLVDLVAQANINNNLPEVQAFTEQIWLETFPEIQKYAIAAGGILVIGLFLRKV